MIFLWIMNFVRGYVQVHLTGYAPERFLNLCGKQNILIWDLKVSEDGYFFKISRKGFKMLRPILKKTRTRVKITEKKGMPVYLHRYRKRKVFACGFVLCIFMLWYLSGFIWNIEINGNSYLSKETVLAFLEENGAGFGTAIKSIDAAALEETLRSDYPEVIWTSIKIYGTKLSVDMQESLLSDKAYTPAGDEACDIIASKDGIITSMITRQGTPLVTVGTEVKKGDCLVSGEIEIVDDYGEIIDYIYECADADIVARVSLDYSSYISVLYQEKIFTQEEKQSYVLQIGDLIIQNPFVREPEGFYDLVTEDIQLKLGENFYLPLLIKKITYYPYELEQREHTKEEIQKIAANDFARYLQKLEEKGIQIIEKNVMIKKASQSKYLVLGTVDAYESIVSFMPVEIRKINVVEGQIEDEFD